MKRNTQANDGKILRYSLRKYKLGLASVTIGAIFLSFSAVQVVKADEAVSTTESSTQVEPADSSLTTSGLVTETPAAPVTAESTSVSKANEPVSLPEENTSPTETTKLTETSENTPKTPDHRMVSWRHPVKLLRMRLRILLLRGLFACISKSCQVKTSRLLVFGLGMMLRHHHLRRGPGRQGQPHLLKPNRMIMVSI